VTEIWLRALIACLPYQLLLLVNGRLVVVVSRWLPLSHIISSIPFQNGLLESVHVFLCHLTFAPYTLPPPPPSLFQRDAFFSFCALSVSLRAPPPPPFL
jgi:hypothetical protein